MNISSNSKHILLATVTMERGKGGISLVARLLHRVLADTWPTSCVESGISPSIFQKICFAKACWYAQLRRQVSTIVFDQLGIAQVQNFLPARLMAPYAVFIHGVEVWKPIGALERRALLKASTILCNSHFTYKKALKANPWIPQPFVAPLCLEPNYQPSQLRDVPFLAIVLTVGRLDRYKGHDEILNVWPNVVKRVPGAIYWIAGDGERMQYLRAKACTLGVDSSVKFWGFVPNDILPDLYSQCAVFAMPSYGEGFGLVYLEAMRHRKPCIGSVHDAAVEVIVHDETGLLVDQGNLEELENALVGFLLNSDACKTFGEAGYERESTMFTFHNFSNIVKSAVSGLGHYVVG